MAFWGPYFSFPQSAVSESGTDLGIPAAIIAGVRDLPPLWCRILDNLRVTVEMSGNLVEGSEGHVDGAASLETFVYAFKILLHGYRIISN